ncbi:MAG: sigma-70 family RNA polymerase sigma factor [Planctomycetes bacterium]|nr:sigma-70 family RNA polymerase sigma factor [Planctomycetota bacterium]
MNRPDSDLLVRFREGDPNAFDAIVERFERRLIGYFYGLCCDQQLSEDCAQEVFVRLFRARESYEPRADLATFVFRIARNHWIDVYRSRKVRPPERSLDAGRPDEEAGPVADTLAGSDASPEESALAEEEQRRLRAALVKLPEIQRAVLALAGGQGMKYEQIALVLGIPVGTVKSRVHAAVLNLRRLLGAEEPRTQR